MLEIAIVAVSDAYISSAGALEDAITLIRERRSRVLPDAPVETEIRLRRVSCEGGDNGNLASFGIDGETGQFAFIWVPSFRIGSPEHAAARIRDLAPLGRWLVSQWQAGAVIGASGAATLLLLEHKLLKVQKIPVSTALFPLLKALYPRIGKDDRHPILEQHNICVSSGFGHDIELVARVLDRLASPASSAWYRSVAGIERAGLPDLAEDPLISAAQLRIEQQFATGLSMSALAADLATSHPTLIRRFKAALGVTPIHYLQDQRLAAAKRLLCNTNRPIGSIARLVGFSDPRSFRELFQSKVGVSAREFRRGQARAGKDHIGD